MIQTTTASTTKQIDKNRKGASRNFLVPNARLMFPSLYKTKLNTLNGKQEYQCALVLTEDNPIIKSLKAELNDLAKSFFTRDELTNPKFTHFLKKPKTNKEWSMWGKDCAYFFNTKAQADQPPKIVGPDRAPLSDRSMLSNNAIVNVLVSLYAYRRPTGVGITTYIQALQVVQGGTRSVEINSVFEDLSTQPMDSAEDFGVDPDGDEVAQDTPTDDGNPVEQAELEDMQSELWDDSETEIEEDYGSAPDNNDMIDW